MDRIIRCTSLYFLELFAIGIILSSPCWGLHRPSRSMHFGDVFGDERRDKFAGPPIMTRPEPDRPRRIKDKATLDRALDSRTTMKTRCSQY